MLPRQNSQIQLNKQVLRKQLLAARNNLASQELEVCSAKIMQQLQQVPELEKAQTIMGYLAFGKEISVDGILTEFLQVGKRVCVPFIKDTASNLIEAIYLSNLKAVEIGEFGIRVPKQIATCGPKQLDVILVPGLAFATNGSRLGLGKGYYDRFLPKAPNAVYIGVAAEYNLLEFLPVTNQDVTMDYIVTETRIIKL